MALEYYFLFLVASFFSLIYEYENKVIKQKKGSYYFHSLFIFLLILFIGFRYKVGGDWPSYSIFYDLNEFEKAANIYHKRRLVSRLY